MTKLDILAIILAFIGMIVGCNGITFDHPWTLILGLALIAISQAICYIRCKAHRG